MRITSLLLNLLCTCVLAAQTIPTGNLHGYLHDAKTGEVLIGATVALLPGGTGTVTNAYGFFSVARPQDAETVVLSYVGYATRELSVAGLGDEALNIELTAAGTALGEVVVSAKSGQASRRQFAATELNVADIKRLPAFAGEADLVKALQLTAGVKNNSEGSSGMFVRGGGADQNLILLDEARLYNPAHLFGLISVFNPDALKDVKLYKGTFPASFGGRASSVLDVRTRDGNTKKIRFAGGLSPLAARLSADGPLAGERLTFMVGARRSLFDLAVEPGKEVELEPRFTDFNLKAKLKTNTTDQLLFSAYIGNDRLRSALDFDNRWGNATASLRYVKQVNSKLFATASLIHGAYTNDLDFKAAGVDFSWSNALSTQTGKLDLSFYPATNHRVYAGFESQYHRFTPGNSGNTESSIPDSRAVESAVYLQHDWQINERLSVNYGLRLSGQFNVGQTLLYDYPTDGSTPTSRTVSGNYHRAISLEPRLQISYGVSDASTLKFAYTRAAQYQHLLRNATLSYSSLETWFPANPNVAPLLAQTASLGWFYSKTDKLAATVEVFVRRSDNQLDYIPQASFINNPLVEGQVRAGEAQAYGVELSLKKRSGRFTGGLNYSFSRALLIIPGINTGQEYPAYWDIPHDLKLDLRADLSPRLAFSLTATLSSGRPITLPSFFYEGVGGRRVPIYTSRNGARTAFYHRADAAFTLQPKAEHGRFASTWSAGVYNLYNRKNALGYELSDRGGGLQVNKFALFGAVPFVSWSFVLE